MFELPESVLEQIPLGWAWLKSGKTLRTPRHIRYINQYLYKVATGQIKRLRIHLPPGHYKSESVSVWFPAWLMNYNPECYIMLVCNNQDLATDFGRKVRDIVNQHGRYKVRQDVQAAGHWLIEGHRGGMSCYGVGSTILGRRPNCIIVDDPVAKADQVLSLTNRDKEWNWHRTELLTRLEPNGSIIYVFQRWHQDDISARIDRMAQSIGEEWVEISLAALALENDPLGRNVGEALDPERYDEEALRIIKGTQGWWFEAMYQQRPISPEGQVVKIEWFRVVEAIPKVIGICRAWDMAVKSQSGKPHGDFAAGALTVKDDSLQYGLLDIRRCQKTAVGMEQEMSDTVLADQLFFERLGYPKDWFVNNYELWFESDTGGTGEMAASYLTRRILDLTRLPIRVYYEHPTGPKPIRAKPLLAQAMAGNYWIYGRQSNEGFATPISVWDMVGMLGRIGVFPNAEYDDEIDAMAMAFSKLMRVTGSTSHGVWL